MTRWLWCELFGVALLAALGAAMLPLGTGHLGFSWDALNHHVYLGLIAEHPRWDRDVLAASVQSYQYPYLYWPVYRLSLLSGSGAWLGAGWAAAQAMLVALPLWVVAWKLLPAQRGAAQASVERMAACALAFTSTVVLSALETTANDLLAAVPLLWAVAVHLRGPSSLRHATLAAALWGLAVACKLSNVLFLPLLLAWWWQQPAPQWSLRRGAALVLGAGLGFAVAYAPWGWTLWQQTGNPFHPYLGSLFGAA
jgi:hypothetical protein